MRSMLQLAGNCYDLLCRQTETGSFVFPKTVPDPFAVAKQLTKQDSVALVGHSMVRPRNWINVANGTKMNAKLQDDSIP
jgi:hypothetical protein